MSEQDFVQQLAEKIKKRDEDKNTTFQKIQYEDGLKRETGNDMFKSVRAWVMNAVDGLNKALSRKVVTFQDEGENSFRLTGEGSSKNIAQIEFVPNGTIKFSIPSMTNFATLDRVSGEYSPRVEGNVAHFTDGVKLFTAEDMGKVFVNSVTGFHG